MLKKLSVLIFAAFFSIQVFAQTDEDGVKAVITKLFSSMKASDEQAVLSCFADQAIMQSIIKDKEGKNSIKSDGVAGFAAFVGKQPQGAADERIVFETIKIDGDLAFAWTPYQFFYNGKFSHCGVDAFGLIKVNGAWKIHYLIDTRRKDNCL
jgi:ketosteroid isomerase-like protein